MPPGTVAAEGGRLGPLFCFHLAPGTESDLSLRGSVQRSPEVRFDGGEGVVRRTQVASSNSTLSDQA